jgi:hypothetical protein
MHRHRLVGGDHRFAGQRSPPTRFDPPINCTTTSTAGAAARATGSSYQRRPDSDTPRARVRSRADTAVTAIGRPARAVMTSALSRSSFSTPPPTVPRPATATERGWVMGAEPEVAVQRLWALRRHPIDWRNRLHSRPH